MLGRDSNHCLAYLFICLQAGLVGMGRPGFILPRFVTVAQHGACGPVLRDILHAGKNSSYPGFLNDVIGMPSRSWASHTRSSKRS
jgi:hypothetical protein